MDPSPGREGCRSRYPPLGRDLTEHDCINWHPFPGFYPYFPQRRHASPALRAFADFLCGAARS